MRNNYVLWQLINVEKTQLVGLDDLASQTARHIKRQWVPVTMLAIAPLMGIKRAGVEQNHTRANLSLPNTRACCLNIPLRPKVIASRKMPLPPEFFYAALVNGEEDLFFSFPPATDDKFRGPIGDNPMTKSHRCFVGPKPSVFFE